MKTPWLLLLLGLTLAVGGCQYRSADRVPAGSFRLVVDDLVKDDSFRAAALTIESPQGGMVSLASESSHNSCALLRPAALPLFAARISFLASRTTDARGSNSVIQTDLQVKSEGGDGGMLIQGSVQAGGPATYPQRGLVKLEAVASLNAVSGVYPLDTPLEIGRIDGRPLRLTVTMKKPPTIGPAKE